MNLPLVTDLGIAETDVRTALHPIARAGQWQGRNVSKYNISMHILWRVSNILL
jgi:DNA-binding transcriptional regulator PaaX